MIALSWEGPMTQKFSGAYFQPKSIRRHAYHHVMPSTGFYGKAEKVQKTRFSRFFQKPKWTFFSPSCKIARRNFCHQKNFLWTTKSHKNSQKNFQVHILKNERGVRFARGCQNPGFCPPPGFCDSSLASIVLAWLRRAQEDPKTIPQLNESTLQFCLLLQ